MAKNTETNARRAADKADTAYQFVVCFGLALMAGFIGTAGAFMMHAVAA